MPKAPESQESFADRLRIIVEECTSQAEFAKHAGVSLGALRKWLSGKAEPSRTNLIALANAGNVTVQWLAVGIGPMTANLTQGLIPPAPLDSEHASEHEYIYVPRYEIEASAGPGTFADREKVADYMAFRADWVRRTLGVDPARLVVISAVGDSMEPAIRSGDLLLIDTSITRVQDDAIYVVVKQDMLVVKRLQSFFTGAVTVRSDNREYAEETLTPEEARHLIVAGRVRWIGRLI